MRYDNELPRRDVTGNFLIDQFAVALSEFLVVVRRLSLVHKNVSSDVKVLLVTTNIPSHLALQALFQAQIALVVALEDLRAKRFSQNAHAEVALHGE